MLDSTQEEHLESRESWVLSSQIGEWADGSTSDCGVGNGGGGGAMVIIWM